MIVISIIFVSIVLIVMINEPKEQDTRLPPFTKEEAEHYYKNFDEYNPN